MFDLAVSYLVTDNSVHSAFFLQYSLVNSPLSEKNFFPGFILQSPPCL